MFSSCAAFAELLDNALDEVATGATYVNVDMLESKKEGTRMLLIEDNGGGMDPEKMRQCMSLGYSAKSKLANTIGQYGNGFKTSTMRLGADVIVFSVCPGKDGKSSTRSIGLLSYTFLRSTGKEDIVVNFGSRESRDCKFQTVISCFKLESVMSIIAKYALDGGLSPRIFVAERLAVASAILIPLALLFERKTRPPMTPKIFAQIVAMSIFEPLLEQNLYYGGMQLTTPTFTSGMFNLLPAITFVVACVFRLEKVAIHGHRGKAKMLGTCVAVGGAMMMTFWRGHIIPLPWTGAVHTKKIYKHEDIVRGGLMLVSSCLSRSFYMMIRAKVVVSYPAKLSLTALICTFGAIGSTVIALIWERNTPKPWTVRPYITMLASLSGGCFSAGTVCLVGWIVKKKGPVFVSIFNPISLIATAAISSVVLSEQMFVGRIIGAFVIILGISFFLWGKMGEQTSPEEPEAT